MFAHIQVLDGVILRRLPITIVIDMTPDKSWWQISRWEFPSRGVVREVNECSDENQSGNQSSGGVE